MEPLLPADLGPATYGAAACSRRPPRTVAPSSSVAWSRSRVGRPRGGVREGQRSGRGRGLIRRRSRPSAAVPPVPRRRAPADVRSTDPGQRSTANGASTRCGRGHPASRHRSHGPRRPAHLARRVELPVVADLVDDHGVHGEPAALVDPHPQEALPVLQRLRGELPALHQRQPGERDVGREDVGPERARSRSSSRGPRGPARPSRAGRTATAPPPARPCPRAPARPAPAPPRRPRTAAAAGAWT